MTGTGTKADPYVIRTWAELLSTVVQTDVYIELGSDIDCKELGAVIVDESYDMNFAVLDGKKHSIKNLYLLDSITLFHAVKSNTIKNLTIKNVYMNNSSPFFLFKSDGDNGYLKLPTFINCHFSSECTNHSSFIDTITTGSYSAAFRKCTFHIRCDNSEFMRVRLPQDIRRPILLDECVVELYGTFRYSAFSAQLIETIVEGEITIVESDEEYYTIDVNNVGIYNYYTSEFLKANSIVNLIVHNETNARLWVRTIGETYYDDDDVSHYCTESVFTNVEFIDDIAYSTMNNPSHFCNFIQIKDETYLKSEGFIAESTWDNRYIRMQSLEGLPYRDSVSEPKAYIDTGVINERDVKILSEFEFSSETSGFAIGGYGSDGYGVAHGSGSGDHIDDLDTISANIKYGFTYGFAGTKIHCYTSGTIWWGTQTEYNMIINGQNYGGLERYGIDGKIYRVAIWDTVSDLIRNYIPAYDPIDDIYGMYDTVNNTFNGSSTEVPFSGGEEMPFKFINGKAEHILSSEVIKLGAFANATHLTAVEIPESVKSIGRYSFANTALKTVTLAEDCTYYETSFPENCVVTGGVLNP